MNRKVPAQPANGGKKLKKPAAALLLFSMLLLCAPAWAGPAGQLDAPPASGPEKAAAPGERNILPAGRGELLAQAQQQATAKKSPPAPKGKAQAAKPAKPAGPSPRALLLQSAGRNSAAPQPEAGFVLNVPDAVGDGEAFLIEFGAQGADALQVEWRGKSLNLGPCYGQKGLCRALLPVPLDEKAGQMPLTLNVSWKGGAQERFSAQLPVVRRKYPVQKLKVAPKFVSPPKSMQEKIKRDRAEFSAAISQTTPVRYWNPPFLRPVPGEVTSLFGLRRVFNGVPKSPHKGVDFDARQGDPVAAIESGVVVLVSNHYYSGNIVIVDHGLGVFSSYIHLSGFNVAMGQKIARGDTIGFIGSTGRVTGPHLHLSLHVLGVGVNAAASIAM